MRPFNTWHHWTWKSLKISSLGTGLNLWVSLFRFWLFAQNSMEYCSLWTLALSECYWQELPFCFASVLDSYSVEFTVLNALKVTPLRTQHLGWIEWNLKAEVVKKMSQIGQLTHLLSSISPCVYYCLSNHMITLIRSCYCEQIQVTSAKCDWGIILPVIYNTIIYSSTNDMTQRKEENCTLYTKKMYYCQQSYGSLLVIQPLYLGQFAFSPSVLLWRLF